MLAATDWTESLLAGLHAVDARDYAAQQSARSIHRLVARKNSLYGAAGLRLEYDGQIIRCVSSNVESIRGRVAQHERELLGVDPLSHGTTEWFTANMEGNVVWWHDLQALERRYAHMKEQVVPLTAVGRTRLQDVPVVVGGDWEFNAWACPAQPTGHFIMVNYGFVYAYCYAVLFFDMLDECREAAEAGQAKGLATSSMLWMAATALGYEPFQWDNLSLPASESDRVWSAVQSPPDELAHAIAAVDAFAVLHECGHIACGHTDRLRHWPAEEGLTAPEREQRRAEMRAFEFEADKFACESILSSGPPGSDSMHALLILFSMLRLCEEQRNVRSLLTSTHPSATDRLRRCFETLGQDADGMVALLDRIVKMITDAARRRVEWQERLREWRQ